AWACTAGRNPRDAKTAQAATVIPVNRKVGKFEILRKLARGGMADVYLGRDDDTGGTIALKLIEHGPDPDTVDSIEAERRGSTLQARLAAVDPRVVQIHGTGGVDDYFYVAMEYIEGEDLSEIIRRGPLPLAQAVELSGEMWQVRVRGPSLRRARAGK